MGNDSLEKINVQPVKQLLNFVERKCEEYDISVIYGSILAMYGNDKSRLVNLKVYIDSKNKNDINKFISQKGKESAIKKRIQSVLHSLLTGKRNNKFYEIEYQATINGVKSVVGALKFHSQDNVRVIAREYNNGRDLIVVMVEGCKKKADKNTGKYGSRLEAAAYNKYYIEDKITNKRIYIP